MNVFTPRPQTLKPVPPRGSPWTAVVLAVVVLVLGGVWVVVRAGDTASEARACARAELRAQAAALEAQFRHVEEAAQILSAVARAAADPVPAFHKAGTDVLAARPGLATVELQPGGLVTAIIPRAPNEQALGLNILTHPIYGADAKAALQSRSLVVSAPAPLYSGLPGLIARMPVYRPGKDGRETFWGFVAASVPFAQALGRAGFPELGRKGYQVLLFIPAQAGRGAVKVAGDTAVSFSDPIRAEVRAGNVGLALAVQPRAGWWKKGQVAGDSLVVLVAACLAGLLAHSLGRTRHMDHELGELNQRLSRGNTEREQAEHNLKRVQDSVAALQAELAQAKAAVERAEAERAKLAKLEGEASRANESTLAFEARNKQLEQSALEMQARLETALRTTEKVAQSRLAELEQTRQALTRVQNENQELSTKLEAARQTEERTVATAQERFNRDLAKIDELQTRLKTLKKTAAEADEASAARILELEESNRELNERLQAAAEALREARAVAVAVQPAPSVAQEIEAEETEAVEDSAQHAESEDRKRKDGKTGRGELAEDDEVREITPDAEPEIAVDDEPAGEEPQPDAPTEYAGSEDTEAAPAPDKAAAAETVLEAGVEQPHEAEPEPAASATKSEAATEPEATKAIPPKARRRKAKRDNQMDLFGEMAGPESVEEEVESRAGVMTAEDELAEQADEPAETQSSGARAKDRAEERQAGAEEKRPRRLPAAPPLDLPEFRKAVSVIIPLLADRDPGAKDCLKDNKTTFRSGFHPEAYAEFEDALKSGQYAPALELLKKAARKHGISV